VKSTTSVLEAALSDVVSRSAP